MSYDLRNFRRTIRGHSLKWSVGCFVVAGAMVAITSTVITSSADASIMLPESSELTLADLEASTQSCGSSAALVDESTDDANERESEPLVHAIQDAVPAGGSSSGGSTSGSGSGGSSVSAFDTVATVVLSDFSLAGRVSGELRLALPSPPGNDLLRPPQAVC